MKICDENYSSSKKQDFLLVLYVQYRLQVQFKVGIDDDRVILRGFRWCLFETQCDRIRRTKF